MRKGETVQGFSPGRQRIIEVVRHRRAKHSLENHGLAMLFAELSAEIEGVGDAANEAIF